MGWCPNMQSGIVVSHFTLRTSAIEIALMSPIVTALTLTCESRAKQVLYALANDLKG
jgi:hypothetical protein